MMEGVEPAQGAKTNGAEGEAALTRSASGVRAGAAAAKGVEPRALFFQVHIFNSHCRLIILWRSDCHDVVVLVRRDEMTASPQGGMLGQFGDKRSGGRRR